VSAAARTIGIATALALLGGCDRGTTTSDTPSASAQPPWFKEAAAASGLRFEHVSGQTGERFLMPESSVGGAALFDMDNDGDLDAYLVQSGHIVQEGSDVKRNALFRNDSGDREPVFVDVSEGSGADDTGYGSGVACGDYDSDGDVDLYVTNLGPNVLLRNDGNGRFTDVTTAARVGDNGFGTAAAFLDMDHDGDLDLYVTNYLNWSVANEISCYGELGKPDYCQPLNYDAPALDVLYRNDGDGTFTDVTAESGVDASIGTGLGIVCGDFTGDGMIDIFIANDSMRDILWANRGNGRFEDVALTYGCGYDHSGLAKAGMGVTAADIDDDGDLDVLVCNLRSESDSLFLNHEGRYFDDSTATAGLGSASRPYTRFGMAWVDLDHDGWLDLYQANGRVMRQSSKFTDDPYAEPNLVFRGGAGGVFRERLPRGGTSEPLYGTSRAAAFGDVDGDGDVDVLVANRDGSAHLLLNVAPKQGQWIGLQVVDETGSDALGATVRMNVGQRTIHRDVRAAYSYLASNDPRVHVGMGDAQTASNVIVRWPDGSEESFGDREAGKYHTLRRGQGQ
jgi:hypothetical protein